MEQRTMRRYVETARVARLATVTADGRPHAVPVCFAVVGDELVTAVDHKPKSSPALRRLEHVRSGGVASLLVDHYDEDWTRLWWVRVDGPARVVDDEAGLAPIADALVAKYEQYRDHRPRGPAIVLEPGRWTGWSAAAGPSRR